MLERKYLARVDAGYSLELARLYGLAAKRPGCGR